MSNRELSKLTFATAAEAIKQALALMYPLTANGQQRQGNVTKIEARRDEATGLFKLVEVAQRPCRAECA